MKEGENVNPHKKRVIAMKDFKSSISLFKALGPEWGQNKPVMGPECKNQKNEEG